MTAETTLVTALAGGTAGALLGARVFPVAASQGAERPYAVYEVASCEPWRSLDGYIGVKTVTITLRLIADTYAGAAAAADAARSALDDQAFASGDETCLFTLSNEQDGEPTSLDDTGALLFERTQTYEATVSE